MTSITQRDFASLLTPWSESPIRTTMWPRLDTPYPDLNAESLIEGHPISGG